MERAEQLFVEAVSASLENKSVSWEEPLTLNEWQRIFYLAESHHVLPMVYETIFRCDAVKKMQITLKRNASSATAERLFHF